MVKMERRLCRLQQVPTSSIRLVSLVFRKVFPVVEQELKGWQRRAERIPNPELRKQALDSINNKRFHCLGGAVFSLLSKDMWKEAIRFIVAYQTISDYLDNLCDRSTSLDPKDFECLHGAMKDALSLKSTYQNYYAFREDQDDGNYLADLVKVCQDTLKKIDNYDMIYGQLSKLESMYSNLQVHKHVKASERIPRLTAWFEENKEHSPDLTWYEFAAATGSTLGIFCIVSYALSRKLTSKTADAIYEAYFPYVQGLHILLDYYIDQQEDIDGGDLNFCSFYPNEEIMKERFVYFMKQADQHVQSLPDAAFHKMIHHGLVGLYLGDSKLKSIQGGTELRKELLAYSGGAAKFFNWNTRMYYRFNRKNDVG